MKYIIISLLMTTSVFARGRKNVAHLDPYYGPSKPIVMDRMSMGATKSNFEKMMTYQTPVRAQESRGTCSIFSATALLEAMLVKEKRMSKNTLDLSEEWMEYLTIASRNAQEDGSWARVNLHLVSKHGIVTEKTLPYIGTSWKTATSGKAKERCGHLTSETQKKTCLIGHWDGSFLKTPIVELESETKGEAQKFIRIKKIALQNKRKILTDWVRPTISGWSMEYSVSYMSEIKELLRKNIPLTMGIDFYYGAWNHSKAPSFGLKRNMDHWAKGIIGVPMVGSKDNKVSEDAKNRAGHSVLVVGYDDTRQVTIDHVMEDGSIEKKTYQGVFYFKNSWGTGSFGSKFTLNGKKYPGYGMMPYAYARIGRFVRLPLEK